MSKQVLGVDVFPLYRPPAQNTGEPLGVQHLRKDVDDGGGGGERHR